MQGYGSVLQSHLVSGQPMDQPVATIQILFRLINRHPVILVGSFKPDPRIVHLNFMPPPCEREFMLDRPGGSVPTIILRSTARFSALRD